MAGRIDAEQVRHIGNLARLKLSDDEIARFGDQLSEILAYVEKLNELDTSDVAPSAHALPVSNVFRADVPGPTLSPSAALANAPARDGSFFAVPKVLDQDHS
jgi:aspartyl-tRNA(Asn)/glutamyl-tRNA(Gln) amidotransferase subunit C